MNARADLRAPDADSDLTWRDLNYDVGWEASSSGVIRCRSVLNRRGDIFNAVEGLDLRTVLCDRRGKNAWDLLQQGQQIRHIEVRLPKPFGPERLYLTAALLQGGGAAGTFCAVDPRSDEVFHGQLALLSHTAEARAREEGYRREAEIMLQGLRVLLGLSTATEKLDALSRLMIDAINGAAHRFLHVGRDGAMRLAANASPIAAGESLTQLFQSQISPVTLHRDESIRSRELRALVEIKTGDVAVIFLPLASESVALVCASRRNQGFLPEDIGFASRFALILKQALVLKDEQDKLVQSAKLSVLGQMSASLAHELRQPLNTISVTAQNLEMLGENEAIAPDILAPKVARILNQVERASQIMDRIRRFSRKGGGIFADVDMVELVEGVRVLMEPALAQAGVRLDIAIERNLRAHCDATEIEQVLTNLIRNAMDALTGIGSARKTANGLIAVRGRRTTNGIAIRVEDNGPGFPADVASRPLETFFTTKGAEAGTGLGLSICHMIARDHAGKLELGNHDCGAYVDLHLPDRSNAETV